MPIFSISSIRILRWPAIRHKEATEAHIVTEEERGIHSLDILVTHEAE